MNKFEYEKLLMRQKYFANLLRILICNVVNIPEDSPTISPLKEIEEEIDKILYGNNNPAVQ